ncbi:hypothetical protein NM688_g3607 [Phlebia brevispora]|uniref:Uncharacterized protein n=1 Tax=Phlebia brevispora TaxID=194682 RepID=A0ACC1T5F0_9APHY|nr:hypothetical protein NM688_g3607 [Phlebia brevispora]
MAYYSSYPVSANHTASTRSGPSYPGMNERPAVEVHADFYFKDLYLQVEQKLFKVLRRTFANDSEVFGGMFLVPQGPNGEIEGSTAERPILLEGVKVNDMVQLLRVLYPKNQGIDEELSSRQWAAVLRLATKWCFMHARTVALSKLSAMADPIDKIVMYNDPAYELDAEQWLLPAVRSFCQRFDGLTVEEGTKLGMELTLRVCAIREKFAAQRAGCRVREHNELLDRIIKVVFELSE